MCVRRCEDGGAHEGGVWPGRRSSGRFLSMSPRKGKMETLIESAGSVNCSHAPHSRPAPPMGDPVPRPTARLRSWMVSSSAHVTMALNRAPRNSGVGRAAEGWVWRGTRRAYGDGGDKVSAPLSTDGALKMSCAAIFTSSWGRRGRF